LHIFVASGIIIKYLLEEDGAGFPSWNQSVVVSQGQLTSGHLFKPSPAGSKETVSIEFPASHADQRLYIGVSSQDEVRKQFLSTVISSFYCAK